MKRYRIYALLHGETLPVGKIFECEIQKMSFAEQEKRKFSPIKSEFAKVREEEKEFQKTYVTSLPYVDPLKVTSEYVIFTDLEEQKPGDALGGAIQTIERVARFLSLTHLEDIKRKFGRNRGSFLPYIYQVNKIYELEEDGSETEVDYSLVSGHVYLPNRPEQTTWRNDTTAQFLDEIYKFHDETLERALKYLYRSSIGYLVLDSVEKMALDHFKSIEIIVKELGVKKINGKKTSFLQKLEDVSQKIGITDDEKETIKRFWDERSTYGDVAHPSPFEQTYPNQFPVPSNTRYSGSGFDAVAPSVVLKYYKYVKGIYIVDIDEPSVDDGREVSSGSFSIIYEISFWGPTKRNRLVYHTFEKDKHRLKNELMKAFANEFKVDLKEIVEVEMLPRDASVFRERSIKIRVCTKQ